MVLYGLVGIEILKQRRLFKSISNDFVGLDTMGSGMDSISPDHFNDMNVEISNDTLHSPSQDGKPAGSVSLSKSIAEMSASDNYAIEHAPRSRSPVSFRQYIFMPLMFLVVLLAIWVAPTTNRILSLINPSFVSYPLLLAVGLTGSLRGFWNGVVFVTLGTKERKRQKKSNITRNRGQV
jgi:hypothetical protein